MNGAEILTTIAQLGVAVAGFSRIAIVFNRQPGGLTGFEAFSSFALVRKQFRGRFPGAHSIRVFLPGMEAGHNLADRQRDLCCFRSGVYRERTLPGRADFGASIENSSISSCSPSWRAGT